MLSTINNIPQEQWNGMTNEARSIILEKDYNDMLNSDAKLLHEDGSDEPISYSEYLMKLGVNEFGKPLGDNEIINPIVVDDVNTQLSTNESDPDYISPSEAALSIIKEGTVMNVNGVGVRIKTVSKDGTVTGNDMSNGEQISFYIDEWGTYTWTVPPVGMQLSGSNFDKARIDLKDGKTDQEVFTTGNGAQVTIEGGIVGTEGAVGLDLTIKTLPNEDLFGYHNDLIKYTKQDASFKFNKNTTPSWIYDMGWRSRKGDLKRRYSELIRSLKRFKLGKRGPANSPNHVNGAHIFHLKSNDEFYNG